MPGASQTLAPGHSLSIVPPPPAPSGQRCPSCQTRQEVERDPPKVTHNCLVVALAYSNHAIFYLPNHLLLVSSSEDVLGPAFSWA